MKTEITIKISDMEKITDGVESLLSDLKNFGNVQMPKQKMIETATEVSELLKTYHSKKTITVRGEQSDGTCHGCCFFNKDDLLSLCSLDEYYLSINFQDCTSDDCLNDNYIYKEVKD